MKERKNFVELIEKEAFSKKSLTENLGVAYESSGKYLVDFMFKLSQYRSMTEEEIKNDFTRVAFEDFRTAVKFIFYVGDVRGGLGERKVFRACFDWLVENKPEVACALLELIPEYTRWDNLSRLVACKNKKISNKSANIIAKQLVKDYKAMQLNHPISLCAKWMPSINASSKETTRLANIICNKLELSKKKYRTLLSSLRAYLNVTEVAMSANNWSEIDYSAVPSKANVLYGDAFLRHDYARRSNFLDSLKNGEEKINASVLQPHEIVRKYYEKGYSRYLKNVDVTLEELWKALPNVNIYDSLVVRDGSGSMTCRLGTGVTTCLDVATAIAIYCSEHNSSVWKDKFITFSHNPKFVNLSGCFTLRDKLMMCNRETECSNTDIAKTMRLVLKTAVDNKLTQEELPENIIIISDMQFDSYRYGSFNWSKTVFEKISEDFENAGYKLPRIVFWNVASRSSDTIPIQNNDNGLVLCSGFSTNILRMVMSGELDPYKVVLSQINTKRYDIIDEILKSINII